MILRIHINFLSDSPVALILALACLVSLSIAPWASGIEAPEEVFTIETIGTAAINEGEAFSAEQAAIKNALQLAIDEGLERVLSSEILADNFEEIVTTFYGSVETFILNYRKLAVTKNDDYCRVLVQSSILAGDIEERIRQAGILIDRELMPRLLILLSEERPGKAPLYWWHGEATDIMTVAEKAMTKDFARRGIAAVPHDREVPGIDQADFSAELRDEEALAIGKHLAADFVITGRSSLVFPHDYTAEKAGDALGVIEARLLDVSTGSRVFVANLQRQADDAEAPSDVLSALAAVGRAATRQFAPFIITAFEQQKNQSRVFQIRIQGAGYLAYLNTFRDFLDSIDRISKPQINEMKIDEAVISVDFSGRLQELVSALTERPSDGLAITVIDVLEDSVVIELTAVDIAADLNNAEETFRP